MAHALWLFAEYQEPTFDMKLFDTIADTLACLARTLADIRMRCPTRECRWMDLEKMSKSVSGPSDAESLSIFGYFVVIH